MAECLSRVLYNMRWFSFSFFLYNPLLPLVVRLLFLLLLLLLLLLKGGGTPGGGALFTLFQELLGSRKNFQEGEEVEGEEGSRGSGRGHVASPASIFRFAKFQTARISIRKQSPIRGIWLGIPIAYSCIQDGSCVSFPPPFLLPPPPSSSISIRFHLIRFLILMEWPSSVCCPIESPSIRTQHVKRQEGGWV